MHCGVMVTGYNQGDWERLLAGDYDRPPTVPDATPVRCHVGARGVGGAVGLRLDLGDRALRLCVFDAAEPVAVPGVLGGAHVTRRRGDRSGRGAVVEPGAARERALDARHPLAGHDDCISDWAGESRPTSTRRSACRRSGHTTTSTRSSTSCVPPTGPSASPTTVTSFRSRRPPSGPQARHKGELTIDIKVAGSSTDIGAPCRRTRPRSDVRRGRQPRADGDEDRAVQRHPLRARSAPRPADHAAVDVLRGDRRGGRGGLAVLRQPDASRAAPLLRVEQPRLRRRQGHGALPEDAIGRRRGR